LATKDVTQYSRNYDLGPKEQLDKHNNEDAFDSLIEDTDYEVCGVKTGEHEDSHRIILILVSQGDPEDPSKTPRQVVKEVEKRFRDGLDMEPFTIISEETTYVTALNKAEGVEDKE